MKELETTVCPVRGRWHVPGRAPGPAPEYPDSHLYSALLGIQLSAGRTSNWKQSYYVCRNMTTSLFLWADGATACYICQITSPTTKLFKEFKP